MPPGTDTWRHIAAGPQYYIREPGGELLADYGGDVGGPRSYYYDALGNAVFLTSYGSVYNGLAYGAWGNLVDSLNTPDTPVQFVGQLGYYTHDSTAFGSALGSLMQLGVRFYDTGIGRFTQRDPLGDSGGVNPGVLASYAYANGNPIALVDPSGLDTCEIGKVTCIKWIGKPLGELEWVCVDRFLNNLNGMRIDTCADQKRKKNGKSVTHPYWFRIWVGVDLVNTNVKCTYKGTFTGMEYELVPPPKKKSP